jgi:TRAP-type transport system periplasmic protein
VYGDLSDADKAAFVEAAKKAGEASRKFAAEAQAKGVAALESSGMQVTKEIKRDSFVSAMASAIPGYEAKFGADLISQIRNVAST